jgi:hypothetical protein
VGVTTKLSEFSAGLTLDNIPVEVVSRARLLILDLVPSVRTHSELIRAEFSAKKDATFSQR